MTSLNPLRVKLLLEDRRHERFARDVCLLLGLSRHNIRVHPFPVGQGSGKQWVSQEYPKLVREHRSKAYQKQIALLVLTDADEITVAKRQGQLEESLDIERLPARLPNERVALWVPKWHIETWLRHFAGEVVDEEKRYSHQVSDTAERKAPDQFVREFRLSQSHPMQLQTLSSLRIAYAETTRLSP